MTDSGIIFDIKKYAIHDGPGIRTTVFLKGCPMSCWWCHNPESICMERESVIFDIQQGCSHFQREKIVGRNITVKEVINEIEKDRIFFDESGGGVTFSGGEPLQQIDFLVSLLEECKHRAIHTAVDTSGYTEWVNFKKINRLVDLYLYDLKIMDEKEHLKYTSVPNKLIHDNLKRLVSEDMQIIIRIPLIPGISDTDKNINAIFIFLSLLTSIKEVHLLPYNVLGKNKWEKFKIKNRLKEISVQTKEDINKIRQKFELSGYRTKIGG